MYILILLSHHLSSQTFIFSSPIIYCFTILMLFFACVSSLFKAIITGKSISLLVSSIKLGRIYFCLSYIWGINTFFLFLPFYLSCLGYEIQGLENLPKEGGAILAYYHGTIPIDIYFIISKIRLECNRSLNTVADRFVYKLHGE